MSKTWDAVHPEMRWYVEDVARQVHRRRWFGAAKRFGWAMFGLTGLFSAALWLTGATGTAGLVLAGLYMAALAALAIAFSIPVLRNKVSLEQVALYIDEKHPELESRFSSALDLSLHDKEGVSAWLTEQFLAESLDRVRGVSLADVLDPAPARNLGYSAAAMVVSSLILVYLFAGSWLPALSLLIPGGSTKVAALPFTVEPGDVRVRRGDNQMIWVRTTEADREVIVRARVPGGEWQEVPASPSSTEKVYYHEFTNVQHDMQYQVRFGRQRSKQFAITAWLPPDVTGIDLTYHYPEYLKQPTREVPNSGNIAAVEGTTVDVDVWTNKNVDQAEMVLESGARLPLVRQDETRWQVPFTIANDDAYRIELTDEEGERNEYPARYTVAMHRDKAPEVKIEFPRGDNEVTMLEEVPFNFSVSDDYGLENFGVQFEVAGREPVRVTLGEGGTLITAADGTHELPLEDLSLEVGDFITWTIWAKDTKPNRDEYEQVGDPFFLEVRPFKREFREAVSGGGQGGQSGQQSEPEEKQKDILIATWNLRRDARFMDDAEFTEKRGIIVDSQTQLIKAVSEGSDPTAPPDQETIKLREVMEGSVEALNRAALPDPKAPLSEATVQQQNALRLLARMKPRQSQVQQTQGGGGGGGGQNQDLNELEMARNRNFYEQENLTREQQEATDEVLDRIKELAQRQQNINEELAKLISELQTAKTEEERERLRQQLERLRDEMKQNLERLDQAKQDLNENAMNNEQARNAQESLDNARHQMNRSLEQMDKNDLQQARASGSRASEALDDIQEQLEQFGRTGAAQRMRALQQNMQDLQQQQKEILAGAESAREMHQSPSMEEQKKIEEMQQTLGASKEKLAEDFKAMMEEASELAARAGQTQELMSRRLGDWMRETSKEGIYEDIQETKPLVDYGIWETALAEEKRIDEKLARAAEGLDAVAEALVGNDLEGMQKALENLDKLLQREEVARALGEQGDQPQPGATGAALTPEDAQQPGAGQGEPNPDQQQPGGGTQTQENQQPGQGQGKQNERMADAQNPQGGRGEQPGEEQQPGSGQGEQRAEDRQNPQGSGQGQQPQDQASSADPSHQPGEQQGGEQGEQGQQQGQRGAQQGNQRMAGSPRGGASGGADNRGGGAWDGNWDADTAMRDFAEDGYADYLENLRDAEALLPPGELRDEVTRLRERVEGMRRDWRVRSLAPRFDLFLEMTARPLADVAADVQREIERLLDEKEFLAQDEGDVPERYREPVADYFKRLSEAEGLK